jgi:hypothetical protein
MLRTVAQPYSLASRENVLIPKTQSDLKNEYESGFTTQRNS